MYSDWNYPLKTMSHWTQLHAAFKLDARLPISDKLIDEHDPHDEVHNLLKTALTKIGIIRKDESILNVFSCVEKPSLSDVMANIKASTTDWDKQHGTFLPSFDVRTFLSSLYLPLLPMTPTGSEGPPNILTSFNDDTDTLMVNVIGSLRDIEPTHAPYIDFWLKCVAVICDTEVLYTYENYDTRKTALIDPYELLINEKVDVLCTYFSTFKKWYEERSTNKTPWTNFVLKNL